MTANEMAPAVGAIVVLRCESLTVNCRVADVKMAYGRPRLLVRPCMGEGEQWVELSRVVRLFGVPPSQQPAYLEAK
jgi:hypothetical protein